MDVYHTLMHLCCDMLLLFFLTQAIKEKQKRNVHVYNLNINKTIAQRKEFIGVVRTLY